jgi:hypothetical protein
LNAVETSDRQVNDKAQWKPLPIQTAAANEVLALAPMIPKLESDLAEAQKDKKLDSKKKEEKLKGLNKTIAETRTRLAHARADGPAKTFSIHDGEALANGETPPQSFYELTANANVPLLTAIRVEVPPHDPAMARHTPENGFIVDKVEGWVLLPNGQRKEITFRCFVQDSKKNLDAAVSVASDPKQDLKEEQPDPSAFAALPKLFRTRWIVGVPSEPLQLAPGSRIQVDLKQVKNIDDKPALIQGVRLAVSGDSSWTALGEDPIRAKNLDRLRQLNTQLAKIPTVPLPVMVEENPYERRATREFDRGNFLTKVGPDLVPDVPAIFPKFPDGAPRTRLTLAKWFFAPGQPLTARVAVNRFWEELFGTGIVETLENFGSVGEEPSHPELLDWMALHFQNDLHWDMKALLREMVTSATYRQSAATNPAVMTKDPRNRLLARGPQQRLSAEMVRDQALLASGLLSTAMGGPPVMPPQPPGIWNSVYNDAKWIDANGPNRYRRAVYTFIKRTSGYPSLLMFDASDRDTSLPRRIQTNTPLQALVTLNDPVYEEAARALAQRVMKKAVANPSGNYSADSILDARLAYETRLVLSRDPTPREMTVLRAFYLRALTMTRPPVLMKVSTKLPEPSGGGEVPGRELDAFTSVGSVLFNLDAALVR